MRRIGWIGVILGTVAAMVTGRFITWALPDFYGMIAYENGPGETTVLSGERQTVATAVSALTMVISWTLAYYLGGLVAGRLARRSAGLNGALTAVCGGLLGVFSFFVVVGPANAVGNPENQALTILHAIVFAFVLFPTSVLASYLGGRAGGGLRARTTNGAFE